MSKIANSLPTAKEATPETPIPRMGLLFWLFKSRPSKNGRCRLCYSITHAQAKAESSTGIRIRPDQWDHRRQAVTGEGADALNSQLSLIRNRFETARLRLEASGEPYTLDDVRQQLQGRMKATAKTPTVAEMLKIYVEHEEKRAKAHGLSRATVQKAEQLRNQLTCYLARSERKQMTMAQINVGFLRDFEMHVAAKYNPEYARKLLYKTKAFVQYAYENGHIPANPVASFRSEIRREAREIVALTADELGRIESKAFDIERLAHVRDCFVFQCYTGLSYSDLQRLSPAQIQTDATGKMWIDFSRIKTGNKFLVPLFPEAERIWNKYEGKLPVCSNVRMNAYLKEIQTLCGIRTRLTTHLGRRTFATILVNRGVSVEALAKMLGHSKINTTQQFYAKTGRELIERELSKLTEEAPKWQAPHPSQPVFRVERGGAAQ